MKRRQLGSTGLRVAELCLGTMTFGGATSFEEAQSIFDRYVEQGGDFVDTAVNYAGGESERIVGELTAGRRDSFVIASKYSAPLRPGDAGAAGNHAKSLRQALDTTLRRLRTDYVDLYWVHAWDQTTPLDELMRVLDDAVRAGKILYTGISNTPAWAVARANTLAEAAGRARFAAIQVEYSLAERTAERELLPMSRALGLGVLAWGPLAGGLLSGKYLTAQDAGAAGPRRLAPDDRRLDERGIAIAEAVSSIATELGQPPGAVALAWLLSRSSRTIPIVGVRARAQLDDLLACVDLLELSASALQRLDAASEVSLGYPHDFLERIRSRYVVG